jgi:hypothetical protein
MDSKGEYNNIYSLHENQIKKGVYFLELNFIFFFLNCFWWNRSPYCYYFPLPPLRGQPTAKCHPRWQPISGQQSTVGWGDCWIRTFGLFEAERNSRLSPILSSVHSGLSLFCVESHSVLSLFYVESHSEFSLF